MAYESVTITYVTYDGGATAYVEVSPSDATSVGVYTDSRITMYNNAGEAHISNEGTLYLVDGPNGNHNNSYGYYDTPFGVSFSPQEAFGDEAIPGRYLLSIRNSTIPIIQKYSDVSDPTSPKVDKTVSRDAVKLSWGAGSEGTNNAVTGYDVQYQDSADGVTWPSSWTTASGSPVTANSMNVSPPTTVGYYRRFRVRTRGSAGSDYYSGWVISTNTLRRKWNAFGTWTDPTLSVGGDLRAAHMTEMQERIKTIRSFYGLSAAAFTTITGGVTLAADWADHIAQIRTAIDGITTDHAAWIIATAGEPAIAVMNQLRNIIDSL